MNNCGLVRLGLVLFGLGALTGCQASQGGSRVDNAARGSVPEDLVLASLYREVVEHYPDGSIHRRYHLLEGVELQPKESYFPYCHGAFECWWANGQRKDFLEFEYGQPKGLCLQWDETGQLMGAYRLCYRTSYRGRNVELAIDVGIVWATGFRGKDEYSQQHLYQRSFPSPVSARTAPPWFSKMELMQSVAEGIGTHVWTERNESGQVSLQRQYRQGYLEREVDSPPWLEGVEGVPSLQDVRLTLDRDDPTSLILELDTPPKTKR